MPVGMEIPKKGAIWSTVIPTDSPTVRRDPPGGWDWIPKEKLLPGLTGAEDVEMEDCPSIDVCKPIAFGL